MAHEIISHAFYGAMAAQPRKNQDPYDFWSEGWMDCAALDLLLGALDQAQMGVIEAPAYLLGRQGIYDQCQRSHTLRYIGENDRKDSRLAAMKLARSRYGGMSRRLRKELGGAAFDPMHTVHLALAIINGTGADEKLIATFHAQAAIFVVAARSGVPLTDKEHRFYASLAAYVDHHDSTRLIRELV